MTGNWLMVRSARQLITLRGPDEPRRGNDLRDLAIVTDGALLVRDGWIMAVGPTRRIENLAEARQARSIDASGRVVMPVLIDSEVHLLPPVMTPPENAPARSSGRPASQARSWLDRMARHGTGRVEVLTGPVTDWPGLTRALRVVEGAGSAAMAVTSTLLAMPAEGARVEQNDRFAEQFCTELLPLIARRRLARFVMLAAGPRYLNNAQNHRILEAVRAAGLGLKVMCDALDPLDGMLLSLEAGVVSVSGFCGPRPFPLSQFASLKGMALITCPAPGVERHEVARSLVDDGFAIALATGFRPPAAGSFSMQHALHAAVSGMRLDPAEAISAATINAAFNHGVGMKTGSLEPGKRADFILWNVSDYHELFARPGVNALHLMACAGKVVYREADVVWG